jgi:murein DD-endopeptidase MepM/ murein hydrolase activator NlpD
VRVLKLVLLILSLQFQGNAQTQLSLPLRHLTLTSGFGYRVHPVTGDYAFHAGIDLRAKSDTVFAIADGVVIAAGYQQFIGLYIRLDHTGIQSIYGHLSKIGVTTGDTVVSGQAIAVSGASGRVTGEHLHFSLLYEGKPIDPIKFLYHLLKYNQNHE